MKKSTIYTFFILLIGLNYSCSKAEVEATDNLELSGLLDYIKLGSLHANRAGNVGIFDAKGFGAEETFSSFESLQVLATFFDDDRTLKTYGSLQVGDMEFLPNQNEHYASRSNVDEQNIKRVFGEEIDIQLNGNDGARDVIFSSQVKMPKRIYIRSPKKTSEYRQSINRNLTVKWNADSNNTKDVFIMIDFIPHDPDNKAFSKKPAYRKVIQTKDDGAHTLGSSDFGKIPKGALIRLLVGRGVYTQTNNNIILYGMSTAEESFIIN